MLRWRGWVVVSVALAAVGTATAVGATGSRGGRGAPASRVARLTLFYTPPVLVRAGERVRVPVDIVCATPSGEPCSASLSITERTKGTAARTVDAGPTRQRAIDFTRAATRAASTGGSVAFSFAARAGSTTVAYPAGGSEPLRFYVARRMPQVSIPDIPFGRTSGGRTVLFLPWGSGRMHAGLQPSRESATLGPSSFDVDARGRIYLLDSEQDRLAVFGNGRLLRELRMPLTPNADIALTGQKAFVGDRFGDSATVRAVTATAITPTASIATQVFGQIRTDGRRAFVNVLPEDTWVAVDGVRGGRSVGLPTSSGGQVLRSGAERRIRLGSVIDGRLHDAVELTTTRTLGEVPFVQMVRPGDYWVVAHPYEETPIRADQFQAIHVVDGRIVRTFAVADRSFADQRPLTRFRMVGRYLYQLVTSPDGTRIVRFDLGRES